MTTIGHFKFYLKTGIARPPPEIGQILGPKGINMVEFHKQFTDRTSQVRPGIDVRVVLIPKTDKSYRFYLCTPLNTWFIMRAGRVLGGGGRWFHDDTSTWNGNITAKECYHIALLKQMDPPNIGKPLRKYTRHILTTARAMGVEVSNELHPDFVENRTIPIRKLEDMQKTFKESKKAPESAAERAARFKKMKESQGKK